MCIIHAMQSLLRQQIAAKAFGKVALGHWGRGGHASRTGRSSRVRTHIPGTELGWVKVVEFMQSRYVPAAKLGAQVPSSADCLQGEIELRVGEFSCAHGEYLIPAIKET
jgi:hypothetical protein